MNLTKQIPTHYAGYCLDCQKRYEAKNAQARAHRAGAH